MGTSVCGMLYADNVGVVSNPTEGFARMMTVIMIEIKRVGLTVPEPKTETTLLRTLNQVLPIPPLFVKTAGKRYMQTM